MSFNDAIDRLMQWAFGLFFFGVVIMIALGILIMAIQWTVRTVRTITNKIGGNTQ